MKIKLQKPTKEMFFEKMLVMMICAKDCKEKDHLLIFKQKVEFFVFDLSEIWNNYFILVKTYIKMYH